MSTPEVPIHVQLLAPPLYIMTTACLEKAVGISALNDAIEAVRAVIERRGGQLNIKKAPSLTSEKDQAELDKMMRDQELAAQEVSGDDDSEEDSSESESEAEGEGAGGAGGAAGGAGDKSETKGGK